MSNAVIVTDLGFGDAGKGVTVDRLATKAILETGLMPTVVRYNGGCQAAHNVVRDDGTHHTFAQFGAGTFAGARTFLSRFMMVEPLSLVNEARHLQKCGVGNPFDLLTVDRECLLTTPYHWMLNQAREAARGDDRHGSCGLGIGETASYALKHGVYAPIAGDLERNGRALWSKLFALREFATTEFPHVDFPPVERIIEDYNQIPLKLVDSSHLEVLADKGQLILEGAQGVLLDEWHGFHPHTTWSTTTSANAKLLLDEIGYTDYSVLGVIRSYYSRHGAGPFPTEDPSLILPEPHNTPHPWMGNWRVGHFDSLLFIYAIEANGGVDAVAVTHWLQRNDVKHCVGYRLPGFGGSAIESIRPNHEHDLQLQEQFTQILFHAAPVLERAPAMMSHLYDVPIYSTGHGPRTSDHYLVMQESMMAS